MLYKLFLIFTIFFASDFSRIKRIKIKTAVLKKEEVFKLHLEK